MELEGPQEPQEQEPQQPQEQPVDPRVALEIAARQFGVTPEELESTVRLQDENRRVFEENRRRLREIEAREARVEALGRERERYAPPEPTYEVDPVVRPIFEKVNSLERLIMQERQERAQQIEHQQKVERTAKELDRHYLAAMRSVPSQNQVDQDRFFAAMAEIYPTETGELPPGITPEKAVFFTAKYLGLNPSGMGQGYNPRASGNPMTDRRAAVVIPGGGTAYQPPQGPTNAPQNGETVEQWSKRELERIQNAMGRGFPDGYKTNSG